jgi:hypothetical protein
MNATDFGTLLSVGGGILSVIGNLINTIRRDHLKAISIWTVSSAMIFIWAGGFLLQWWDGGLGVAAIMGMNGVFLISNIWGVIQERRRRMTNTYTDDTSLEIKTYEEIRCLRCCLERLLMSTDPAGFKDYQLEKFSGSAEAREAQRKEFNSRAYPHLKR